MTVYNVDTGENEWDTIKYFKAEWWTQIDAYQSDLFHKNNIKRHMSWLEYLPNSESPRDSRFRCRLCRNYFKTLRVSSDGKYLSFSSDEGVLKKNPKLNSNAMNQHSRSSSHQTIIEKLKAQVVYCNPHNQF